MSDNNNSMEAPWAVTTEKVRLAIQRLVLHENPKRIILFGSAARGGMNVNSDADILVVLRKEVENPRKESVRLRRVLRGIGMSVDIIVISESQLSVLGDQPGLIYREALQTGKVMYEAA